MRTFLTEAFSPIRVLLVEDNPGDAELVQDALRESPDARFDVTHVDCLAKALLYISKADIDIIILDLRLPDAVELDTLLRTYEAAPKVPILVLSGINNEVLAMKAMQHGAQDYLAKDQMDGRLLVHSICHAIERHRLHAKLAQLRQKQMENQKLQSLGILAGGLAHDFNNLLTVILGRAERTYRRAGVTLDTKKAMERIKIASHRATELCRQLLAYSGKGQYMMAPLNLNELIEKIIPSLQQSIPDKITLRHQLSKTLPPIEADITQIRQLITNVVLNASEAIGNDPGYITIITSLLHLDHQYLAETFVGSDLSTGDYVCMEITDTGCGMDSETRSRVFDPFFSTKFSGRGLGLAAVHGIVRAHKGALEVISEKGKGSTFSILFPSCKATKAIQPEVKLPGGKWRGKGKILVVDDEEDVRTMLGETLKELGFDPLLASQGLEGIETYRKYQKDIVLVILDMIMPRMSGNEVYNNIRQINANAHILFMSGYSETEFPGVSDKKNPTHFILKPFKFMDLRDKIRTAIQD